MYPLRLLALAPAFFLVACALDPTTVIDLSGSAPVVVREGRGPLAALGL